MGLQQRKTLLEIFSTFLEVREDPQEFSAGWLIDTRLQNSMESRIQEDPKANEDYWALFWLNQVLKNPQQSFARGHLSAYLEEVCYRITDKDIKNILEIYHISLVDGFLIVRSIAAKPEILTNYKSERGKVKYYAQKCIAVKAKEEIRQGRDKEKFSKIGLLRYSSKKCFIESLKTAGIKDPKFSELFLARQAFQAIYTVKAPNGCQKLPPPPPEKLVEIAEYYNQHRPPHLQEIKSETLEEMLEECQDALRAYYSSPKLIYSDTLEECQQQIEINQSSELIDESDYLDDQLQEVNLVLSKAFEKLKSEDRKILQLSIGLNMTQSEIGEILNIIQSQVSRHRRASKGALITALAKWSVKKFQIELKSEKLNDMSPQLDEWLAQYCTLPFHQCLKVALLESFPSDIPTLTQLYEQELKPKIVAEKLNISEDQLKQNVEQIKQHLQEKLLVHLKKCLKVSLKPCSSASQKIANFVNTWLENAPYATFR